LAIVDFENFQTKPKKLKETREPGQKESKAKPMELRQEDRSSTDEVSEIDDVDMEEASQIGEKRQRDKEPTPEERTIRKKCKSNTSEARA
jgi:hypothetical protein